MNAWSKSKSRRRREAGIALDLEPQKAENQASGTGASLPLADDKTLTLRERRCLFTRLLAEFIVKANKIPGVELALDEATVQSPRVVWLKGNRTKLEDAVHKQGSKHHTGEAADLNLYYHGLYVEDGDSPIWRQLAELWEGMHHLAVSGRRWRDANHLALGEGDKTEPLP